MRRIADLTRSVAFAFCMTAMLGLTVSAAQADSKNTTPAKTQKQCDSERTACDKNCVDTQIDVGNQIQQCKDGCTDKWVTCVPSAKPRANVGGVHSGATVDPGPRTTVKNPEGGVPVGGGTLAH